MTEAESVRGLLSSDMPSELLLHPHHLDRVVTRGERRARRRRMTAAGGVLAVMSVVGITGVTWWSTTPPETTVADADLVPARAEPWSAVSVTTPTWLPDNSFLVAQGRARGPAWQVVSARLAHDEQGCLLKADADSMGDTHGVCFDTWPVGQTTQLRTWPLSDTQQLAVGAVSATARTVEVQLSDGTTVTADAVATPSSDVLRYFAVPVPAGSVEDVAGVTGNGEVAAPPPGLPWSSSCANSGAPCPTPAS